MSFKYLLLAHSIPISGYLLQVAFVSFLVLPPEVHQIGLQSDSVPVKRSSLLEEHVSELII